jgi:UDP-N-acetylmuramate: L-alanyl-gamma-D-glutamyl-meso-diaminopimelate ligase
MQSDSTWRLGEMVIEPPVTRFQVIRAGTDYATFETRMIGAHNLKNILSAIAVADHLGVTPEQTAAALARFKGVRRRQEIRGEKNGILVMDDFAHHPTAVRETVRAVKSHFSNHRVVAVFEPRTNSSMRKVFQNDYVAVFDPADRICIRKPSLLAKVPVEERLSSRQLVDDLKTRGKDAALFEDTQAIIDDLVHTSMRGDVILVMSNGGFDNIHDRLLTAL